MQNILVNMDPIFVLMGTLSHSAPWATLAPSDKRLMGTMQSPMSLTPFHRGHSALLHRGHSGAKPAWNCGTLIKVPKAKPNKVAVTGGTSAFFITVWITFKARLHRFPLEFLAAVAAFV
jgi:hypothetical protein